MILAGAVVVFEIGLTVLQPSNAVFVTLVTSCLVESKLNTVSRVKLQIVKLSADLVNKHMFERSRVEIVTENVADFEALVAGPSRVDGGATRWDDPVQCTTDLVDSLR